MHIGFLIRALDIGGSERQLLNLAEGLAYRGHHVTIFTFYPGVLDGEVKKSKLVCLEKKDRWDLQIFWRLRSAIKSQDFFYSFLPTQNIFSQHRWFSKRYQNCLGNPRCGNASAFLFLA